jgi:16S rRNA pseudouridine516 synthase
MARVDQLLSSLGYCSRSEARDWAKARRVLVKGQPIKDPGTKAEPKDIQVDGEALDHPDGLLLLVNKPLGLVCSHDPREGPAIYSLLPERWRRRNPVVTSIGRLDKETSGLILLTDQTELVHKLTSPKHKVPKVYVATLERDANAAELQAITAKFASGSLMLDGEKEPCAPATLVQRSPRVMELTLTEGRYHQVRRMFVAVGFTVIALHRERFGHLDLGELPPGAYKELPLDSFQT